MRISRVEAREWRRVSGKKNDNAGIKKTAQGQYTGITVQQGKGYC